MNNFLPFSVDLIFRWLQISFTRQSVQPMALDAQILNAHFNPQLRLFLIGPLRMRLVYLRKQTWLEAYRFLLTFPVIIKTLVI